jgi:phosphinothricin acetyltransferase
MRSPIHIQPATLADWPHIERIYREGIRTGHATFQNEADIPHGERWFAGHMAGLIFKAVDDVGTLLGWAALSPVSGRCVYAGVAEVSVYVSEAAQGRGVGLALERLVAASEEAGVWTLQAGIFPENVASIELHKRVGFRVVGVREKLRRMNGVWRDVMLMERRSPVI